MKQLVQILMILVVAAVTIMVVVTTADSGATVTITQQPQREKYVAPEWVVNERGQRCIKQGTVVTCG